MEDVVYIGLHKTLGWRWLSVPRPKLVPRLSNEHIIVQGTWYGYHHVMLLKRMRRKR